MTRSRLTDRDNTEEHFVEATFTVNQRLRQVPAHLPETMSPADYLSERKGIPMAQVGQMLERVTSIAASVGLDYHYEDVRQTNTIKAHELIHYAKAKDRQLDMKERLLRAYFVEGRHVGRIDDLADLAADVGLDRDDVIRSLSASEYLADVKADVALARQYGIQGVPFFVIDGKYGVSGAQESTTFADVLRQVQSQRVGSR